MDKINEKHPGWLSRIDGCKDHYYFSEEGDFILSLCGNYLTNKNGTEVHPINGSPNLCKICLSRINKFNNGEKVEFRMKGFLI